MRAFLRQLTFARVMSLLAIFIALGAGAYAAGLKRNSVKSRQIKDGAVHTQDFADDAVEGDKVLHGTITGLQVANDSVGGDSIAENTLQVDTADSTAATNGLQVQKVNLNLGLSETQAIDFGGKASLNTICSSTGNLAMGMSTKVPDSLVESTGTRATAANDLDGVNDLTSNVDPDFDVGDFYVIDLPDGARLFQSTVRYRSADGFILDAKLFTLDENSRCRVWGTAVMG
jgi:hypothetical protein